MIKLTLEYDGTSYAGWQVQPNAVTVQEVMQKAVLETFGVEVAVVGSGRTDAGVHARGQVAHVDLPDGAHDIPIDKVRQAINSQLPRDIRVVKAETAPSEFHARYDPIWREYEYHIAKHASVFLRHYAWHPNGTFDIDLLKSAAEIFVGQHDFTSFSKNNPSTKSYVCKLMICAVEDHEDHWIIRLRADRFVYSMCRSIVGGMMECARGKVSVQELRGALRAANRVNHTLAAPACGLYLTEVEY